MSVTMWGRVCETCSKNKNNWKMCVEHWWCMCAAQWIVFMPTRNALWHAWHGIREEWQPISVRERQFGRKIKHTQRSLRYIFFTVSSSVISLWERASPRRLRRWMCVFVCVHSFSLPHLRWYLSLVVCAPDGKVEEIFWANSDFRWRSKPVVVFSNCVKIEFFIYAKTK